MMTNIIMNMRTLPEMEQNTNKNKPIQIITEVEAEVHILTKEAEAITSLLIETSLIANTHKRKEEILILQ